MWSVDLESVGMKSTTFFVVVYFVVLICCPWNLRISAAFSEGESNLDAHASWRNVELTCSSGADCSTPNSRCTDGRCQCQPNYVFSTDMTLCLKAAEAYGDACEDTAQCTARLLAGGNCDDGICSCVKGYHYLRGRCIKSSGLEEACHSDDECYVNADYEALSCTNKVCLCSDGFYKREYRTCRREAKEAGAECMIDLDCTFNENAKCNKKTGCFVESEKSMDAALREIMSGAPRVPKVQLVRSNVVVGSNCTKDKECETLGPAACDASGKCTCTRGHFLNDKSTSCIPELGENCESNDAVAIKKSVCRDGRWSCSEATVPSRNNQLCRKVTTVYNSSCQYDEQCYVFGPDATCVSKRCLCNENSHYSEENMFCWINRGVGETCKSDVDCYMSGFGSKLACKESACACPTGTHLNAAQSACISDTAVLGDPCTANEDCDSLRNAVCSNLTCICADNYFDLSGKCVSGIGAKCTINTDCKAKNSVCVSNQCSCSEDYASPSAGLCVPASFFGGKCEYDVQCSATAAGAFCAFPEVPKPEETKITESSSSNGTCTCATGHHYNYGRCYRTKVLHEPCLSRGECYVESSPDSVMCLKGECACDWNAVEITDTYCKSRSSSKSVASLIVFAIFAAKFIGFA